MAASKAASKAGGKSPGGKAHPKCAARAKHRTAQNKFVAKNPKAQAARVKKSEAKASTKAGTKAATKQAAKNAGKNHGKIGRPRKPC